MAAARDWEHTLAMATLATIGQLVSAEAAVPATMTVDQYLATMFHPDCEFVDGRIEERNVGEYEHASVQKMLLLILAKMEAAWGINVVPECRLQVGVNRFRVPDVMVLRRGQKVSGIVREAPLVCIEVLSPEDTWAKMRARLNDYLEMGAAHVWCFDPEAREARRYTADGFEVAREAELTVAGTEIRVNVGEVFAVLDEQ